MAVNPKTNPEYYDDYVPPNDESARFAAWLRENLRRTKAGDTKSRTFHFNMRDFDYKDESRWKTEGDPKARRHSFYEDQRYSYEGKARPKAEPRPDGGLRRTKQQDLDREKATRLYAKVIRMVESDQAGQAGAALYQAAKLYTKFRDALTKADRLDFLQQLNEAVLSYVQRFGEVPRDLMPAFQALRP